MLCRRKLTIVLSVILIEGKDLCVRTKVLSGHGAFGEYLHCFGLLDSPESPHRTAVDDVYHTVFVCPFWEERRTGVIAVLGHTPTPEDVEELLCGGGAQAHCDRRACLDMVEGIMAAKKEAERERKRLPRGGS